MTVPSVLAAGRAAMERRYTDTVRVDRLTGTVLDPSTAVEAPSRVVVYEGRAEIKQRAEQPTVRTVAGRDVTTLATMLRVPWDSSPMIDGDRVACTGSVHQPDLVGRLYEITGEHGSSHTTARRYGIVQVTS